MTALCGPARRNTIGEAFRSIQYGEADIMIAGGTEGSICPIGIAGFTALTALSSESDPEAMFPAV